MVILHLLGLTFASFVHEKNAFMQAEKWVSNMSKAEDDEPIVVVGRPARSVVPPHLNLSARATIMFSLAL